MNDKSAILIIGENRQDDVSLDDMLKNDYDIIGVQTCDKALEVIKNRKIELILCNSVLHDVDLCELTGKLSASIAPEFIPIIVNAVALDPNLMKDLASCVDDFLTNPILPELVNARVGFHIERKNLRETLSRFPMIDPLVGIANREYLETMIKREWRRAMRHQTPQSLIIAGVDYFTAYNELYGRSAGDDCLRQISAAISNCVKRETDCVARFQNDTFACLLAETDTMGAVQVANVMLEAVEGLNIPHQKSPIADHVTMSFGVATFKPSSKVSIEKFIRKAEDHLAEAKRLGYNQIKAG